MTRKLSPEWITSIFTAVLAVTGAGALWYAHEQIAEAHNEAQIQHLLSLDQQYNSEPMVTYRKACAQKRLAGEDYPEEEDRILGFFENVGLLVNRGYLNDTDVWEDFSTDIFSYYADSREMIEQDQKDDKPEFSNLVSLVQRLEVIEQAHGGTLAKPSKDDLKDFWDSEVSIGTVSPNKHRPSKR
ncbi:MAG: hypothetical protein ABSC71_21235 [Candidatus Acidiferrales bacterium]|jgi:hypothetical protein